MRVTVNNMASPAPAGGGGGANRSIERVSAVDADKLWRDRINVELLHQRSWGEEYGFMIDDEKRKALLATMSVATATAPGPGGAAKSEGETLSEYKKAMSSAGMASTMMDSYKVRKTPELFNSGEYNRRKFHWA